ncbi:hypothetical protein ACFYWN_40525 [Streptomyces sp. NPDC002917]|uniref:hypothetical protein n=1 Tax=unclassified Streptomyces TaxID=2593676 RepID=UPI0036938244|nr:hypothetical protein OHB03_43715 [Streptomyces sp. NBC_01643]
MDAFAGRLDSGWEWWHAAIIYVVGEQGEIWMKQLLKGELPPEDEIAKAEGFLTGPGSIEDLELFFYD